MMSKHRKAHPRDRVPIILLTDRQTRTQLAESLHNDAEAESAFLVKG